MNDSSPSTSLSLIERVRHEDAEAWKRLCHVYGPLVYRWARVTGLQDSDAADVAQEVFRTVHGRIRSFDARRDGATFRGWLRTIVRNKIGDLLRSQAARPAAVGGTTAWQLHQQLPDDLDSLDNQPGFDAEQFIVHRMLETLQSEFESRTWQAFWMAVVEDRPCDDIAARLSMSAAAVRQAKYRVLRRLRDELGAEDFAVVS